jgi:hypothetical protein
MWYGTRRFHLAAQQADDGSDPFWNPLVFLGIAGIFETPFLAPILSEALEGLFFAWC